MNSHEVIAITGTPGTGKSCTGRALRSAGERVVSVDDLLLEEGIKPGGASETVEVDPSLIRRVAKRAANQHAARRMYLTGHLAHFASWDRAFVLRCSPKELFKRLSQRNWEREKILENVRAEVLDVILVETLQQGNRVYEIDTTSMTCMETAALARMEGRRLRSYRAGRISWFDEVEHWF
ncbi:MAG: adenylate kinase family protein [Methanomassiliicoccales archaeon]